MKKIVSFILSLSLLFDCFVIFSSAKNTSYIDKEYFDDGSYGIISFESSFSFLETKGTTSKTKKYSYYDNNGYLCWYVTLTGVFTYNGTTANCSEASIAYHIYKNSWSLTSSNRSRSGATATGSFTFKNYVLGVPVKTINKTLTLTCSPNGTIT